jgi:hypothetical protein
MKDKGNNKSMAWKLQQEEPKTEIEQEDEGTQVIGSSKQISTHTSQQEAAAICFVKSVGIQCRSAAVTGRTSAGQSNVSSFTP